MQRIYLDHNATAPLEAAAAEALARYTGLAANPSSQHQEGRRARRMLEDAREGIAELLGARLGGPSPDRLFFTSGGTESNNLALFGLAGDQPSDIVISAIEHSAVAEPAERLTSRGWRVARLSAGADGVVNPHQLPELVTEQTRLVSVMLANNETGAVQPVAQLAEICRDRDVLAHTDAAQAVGRIDVDFQALGVDALSASGHKFGGPVGIGLLLLRGEVPLMPMLYGGPQELALRPGTEPVALAVAMHWALASWHQDAAAARQRMAELRGRFEAAITAEIPEAVVVGSAVERLPQTTCVAFPGIDRQALVVALDMAGVACATGSACASGSSERSPTLVAMGLDEPLIEGAIRLSFGPRTSAAELDEAARRIIKACKDLRNASGNRKMPSGSRGQGANSL